MSKRKIIASIEKRAFGVRKTMAELLKESQVAESTFARWKKNPDSMRPTTLAKIERRLDELEKAIA